MLELANLDGFYGRSRALQGVSLGCFSLHQPRENGSTCRVGKCRECPGQLTLELFALQELFPKYAN